MRNKISLFLLTLIPLILILLMVFVFPLLADTIIRRKGFDLYRFYSLIAITLASLIPAFSALLFRFLHVGESKKESAAVEGILHSDFKLSFRRRTLSVFFIALILLLIYILFVDPVAGEGWIRNFFVAFLFGLQASLVYVISICFGDKRFNGFIIPILLFLFIITVPVGLVIYHPWSYLAFFSPFYWIAWAWVIGIPYESLLYGSISIAITFGYISLFCRKYLKKQSGP